MKHPLLYAHDKIKTLSPGQTIEQGLIEGSNFARSNIVRPFGGPWEDVRPTFFVRSNVGEFAFEQTLRYNQQFCLTPQCCNVLPLFQQICVLGRPENVSGPKSHL